MRPACHTELQVKSLHIVALVTRGASEPVESWRFPHRSPQQCGKRHESTGEGGGDQDGLLVEFEGYVGAGGEGGGLVTREVGGDLDAVGEAGADPGHRAQEGGGDDKAPAV